MSPLHRHSWVWTVLPSAPPALLLAGDPYLASVLTASGVRTVPFGDDCTAAGALLVDGDDALLTELAAAGTPLPNLVGLRISRQTRFTGGHRFSRLARRAVSLLGARTTRDRTRAAVGTLHRVGFTTAVTTTTDDTGQYELRTASGPEGGSAGTVVVAHRGASVPSATDEVRAALASSLGCDLRIVRTVVLPSAKVLQELLSPAGDRYVARLGAGPTAALIEQSVAALDALTRAGPPDTLRDLVAWPVVAGRRGVVHYSVERKFRGTSPRRVSPEIWRAGVDFLVDLHLVGRDDATAEQDGPWEQVSRQAETMARHLGPFARDRLDGLVRRQREAVAGVPVGWGHGDLWLQNLLAERGRLIGVVDWDWASPTSLPLLDVLELWAFAHFRAPAEPGPRALYLRARLPRIREDRHVRHYAEAVGLELSEQLLRAAVVAYWLDRVSRDLRPFAGRAANRRWVTANLHRPLAALCDREPGT